MCNSEFTVYSFLTSLSYHFICAHFIKINFIYSTFEFNTNQYKLLYTISNNIEVYQEPMPQTEKIPHCPVKFRAGEKNKIVQKVCTD